MDDSPAASPPPPRRKRGRRRHSADSDIPDEMPTEESTEEDDDETEASEFELKTPKVNQRVDRIVHSCIGCNKIIKVLGDGLELCMAF